MLNWQKGLLAALAVGMLWVPNAEAKDIQAGKIMWQYAGDLAPAAGYTENIGVAGPLCGSYGDYIIVGGGANFPQGGPLVGGPKKTYPDVYVYHVKGERMQLTDQLQMPYEIGYGATVSTPEGVYYIGGSTDPEGAKAISLMTVNQQGKLAGQEIGKLPFTVQNIAAAVVKHKLYLVAGKQDGKLSNKAWCYDLQTKEIKELAAYPGEPREQVVGKVLAGRFYVFSGGSSVCYTDGYAYDFSSDSWTPAADVTNSKGEKVSLLGANSVQLNENEMLVVGGFNKAVYDNAVANLTSLQGDALADFRQAYFGADPAEFKWNRELLIFNAKKNSWRSIGQVPFDAPCGEGLVLIDNKLFSINGEIKPGVRTPRMYLGMISR